jgi:uncharacterized protein
MNRRTFLKRILGGVISLAGLTGGSYVYAKDIEPKMLHTQKVQIKSNRIPAEFNGYKIAQFSDTHIGFHYTLEQLEELVYEINAHNPDLIVFTGDLIDHPNEYNWTNTLTETLKKLTANDGKLWIYGNHDHGGYGTDIVNQTFENANFTLLKNTHTYIERNNEKIVIIGLDDIMLGRPNIDQALPNDSDTFSIILVHEPDYADKVKDYSVDVQLSGHSHGGQVQLPFIGYIYTPYLAEKYVEGSYQVGNRPLQLYVSRGIGTTRLPYRFFCKPEITIYELKKG